MMCSYFNAKTWFQEVDRYGMEKVGKVRMHACSLCGRGLTGVPAATGGEQGRPDRQARHRPRRSAGDERRAEHPVLRGAFRMRPMHAAPLTLARQVSAKDGTGLTDLADKIVALTARQKL